MGGEQGRSAPVVGIDIGGTNMQFGVVDAGNALVGRFSARTEPARGLDAVLDAIVDGIRQACEAAALSLDEIGAVGIAAAGAIDIPHGIVLEAPNLGWIDVPLRDLVRERVGRPVVLENDVNGATWGEYHLGAGEGRGDALGVWVGTGVGGGLVLDGRLHHGAFFTAGEIGHTVIEPHGDSAAGGSRRTVEDLCSRTGMRRLLESKRPGVRLPLGAVQFGTDEIVRAFESRDELTVSIVHEAADLLGVAIANTVTMLAVDHVFVGGGMTEALGAPFFDRIRASFEREVFPDRCRGCRFAMTELAADAGLLGAALIARG